MNRSRRLAISAFAGLAAALVCFMAVTGAHRDAERVEQEMLAQYGGELTSVCVASREIEPGEKIDEGNVVVTEWVSTLLPQGAITGLSSVLGRTATAQIPAHAPLAEAYFEQREGAVDIPRGMVAVSVASDPEHAVGGILTRGETVDVYALGDAYRSRWLAHDAACGQRRGGGGPPDPARPLRRRSREFPHRGANRDGARRDRNVGAHPVG